MSGGRHVKPVERLRIASRYVEAHQRLAAFVAAALRVRHADTVAVVAEVRNDTLTGLSLADLQLLVDVVEILQPSATTPCQLVPRPARLSPLGTTLAAASLGTAIAARLTGRWAICVKVHVDARDRWRVTTPGGSVYLLSEQLAAAARSAVLLPDDAQNGHAGG